MAEAKRPAGKQRASKRVSRRSAPASNRSAAKPAVDLHALGARVVSVFGPYGARVLIEMRAEVAAELFPEPLAGSGPDGVVDAVRRDLDAFRARSEELAESALAASAVELARQLENPYTSATAKSMCARALREAMDRLLELAPRAEEKDGVDDLATRRAKRRAAAAGCSAAADPARS